MFSSKDIRQSFLDFFQARGHTFIASSPVVPEGDPTLLFTNAGMNQFKNIFLGLHEPSVPRAVNSQKCIRAGGKHNDLEEVGKDGYHHTFFEMLGNWSFGDYYKKDAIEWAWELLTEVWKLPKDKLYATVHDSDQEAYELWKKQTDIDPERISFHGDKDNFWEMGETGPCGPCSEIHIDRGEAFCSKKGEEGHVCAVNGDCGRYIELWNLVFIQYNREKDRSLTPLKHKYVDTGAGLERVAQVLQNKSSNYETDLFMPIIDKISQLSGKEYDPETGVSHRVIADHIRCLCFALADGGFPSNEGRGYVLRRILRRAARHGRILGFAEPFMFHLVETVTEIMGHHFLELSGKEAYIKMVIQSEEERFNHTLDTGLQRFDEICARLEGDLIPGKEAFALYDTYGFPLDLTLLLAEEKNLRVDTKGFEEEMELQRKKARESSKFALDAVNSDWIELEPSTPTEFIGYEQQRAECRIQRYLIADDGQLHLQLNQTPFYAESGGQVGDTGKIHNDNLEMEVSNVVKSGDFFVHIGTITRGQVLPGQVIAEIDVSRRKDTARNHTATHMLHKALRSVLGEHVQQKGSLVSPNHLRFDFTHVKGLNRSQVTSIENIVNQTVRENRPVSIAIKPIAEARAEGAIALFGEKYSEQVRVVDVQGFSQELCGGTHVRATGEIGLFKIISESSSAAGIRRIEAVTGTAADEFVLALQDSQTRLSEKLHVPEIMLENKVEALLTQLHEQEAKIKHLEALDSGNEAEKLMQSAKQCEGFRLLAAEVNSDPARLRELGDYLKSKYNDTIAVIFSPTEEKVSILAIVGQSLLSRYHAGKIVSSVASRMGGKGGGRADSAMAGGKDRAQMPAIIKDLPEIIAQSVQ